MNEKNKNEPVSDQQLGFVGMFILAAGAAKFAPRIEFWAKSHLLILTLFVAMLCIGLVELIKYKRRKKNPEAYARKTAINAMRSKNALGPIEGLFADAPKGAVEGEIYVGQTLTDKRRLALTNEQRSGHVQIVGATGRGKTQSVILPWFIQDLYNQNSPILIDGKGDLELEEKIRVHMGRVGCMADYFFFDMARPTWSCTINPLDGGNAQEVADRLISSLDFESSYFRDVQHQVCLMIFELMESIRYPITFEGLYLCLTEPQKLAEIIGYTKAITPSLKQEITRFQSMSQKDREERYSGLTSQIRPFATGDLLQLVNGPRHERSYLSLEKFLATKKSFIYPQAAVISLNTMRLQKSAKIMGKMILQTMAWATSKRDGSERFTPVFMDEFSSFVYDGFEQFLNKSRSYGVALHLSHQSVADLERISPSFLKMVNVNTNVKCLMGLNDPDTADYFAKHLGTRTTTKQTERGKSGLFGSTDMTGDLSVRDVEVYRVSPNRLRNYSQGKGVLSLLVDGTPVTEEIQFEGYRLPTWTEVFDEMRSKRSS